MLLNVPFADLQNEMWASEGDTYVKEANKQLRARGFVAFFFLQTSVYLHLPVEIIRSKECGCDLFVVSPP